MSSKIFDFILVVISVTDFVSAALEDLQILTVWSCNEFGKCFKARIPDIIGTKINVLHLTLVSQRLANRLDRIRTKFVVLHHQFFQILVIDYDVMQVLGAAFRKLVP